MAELTYTIDCGQQTPFKTGRKIERPEELQDRVLLKLLEADGSEFMSWHATKTVVLGRLFVYQGPAKIPGGKEDNVGIVFDTGLKRLIGAINSQNNPSTGVWSASRDR